MWDEDMKLATLVVLTFCCLCPCTPSNQNRRGPPAATLGRSHEAYVTERFHETILGRLLVYPPALAFDSTYSYCSGSPAQLYRHVAVITMCVQPNVGVEGFR
jgi:hypothetical protein